MILHLNSKVLNDHTDLSEEITDHAAILNVPTSTFVQQDILDPSIEKLQLVEPAKTAAYQLKQKFPNIVFTSGFRTIYEQAKAMAENIIKSSNRNYIKETHANSDPIRLLQKWINENPDKTTEEEILLGIESIMNNFSEKDLDRVSKHLTGNAFDIQPVHKNAIEIKNFIRSLPHLTKFLEKEAGLIRWHAQFS